MTKNCVTFKFWCRRYERVKLRVCVGNARARNSFVLVRRCTKMSMKHTAFSSYCIIPLRKSHKFCRSIKVLQETNETREMRKKNRKVARKFRNCVIIFLLSLVRRLDSPFFHSMALSHIKWLDNSLTLMH